LDSTQSVSRSSFTIATESLPNTSYFTYLGSILTDDCDLTEEIQQRIKLASSAFGRLSHRVLLNHNLTIPTKVAVYNTVCISIVLYGCESWIPCRHHVNAMESFHISSLQRILGLRWWHKITRTEIRRRTSCKPLELMLRQQQLRNPHAIQPSSSPYPVW